MKKIITGFLFLLSLSAFANPETITCDKNAMFGFGKLTRVEFVRVGTTDYDMTVSKEKSCGRGSGCMFLDEKFKKTVSLFQSPGVENLLITPDMDRSGDDIKIYTNFGKCKVKIKSKNFKFSGKAIDVDGVSYLE